MKPGGALEPMGGAGKVVEADETFIGVREGANKKRGNAGEYVRGDAFTNTAEGIFALFKRGMKGVYQHCGEQHLHRYLAELDFRYSNRVAMGENDQGRANTAIKGVAGKRLTYGGCSGLKGTCKRNIPPKHWLD
jgi:hypothetical protein